ncbi:MAG: hypothetical protein IPK82_26830 [Polyangiaceae bacterium]|nr:hypothetical protein [Polyangiaceae bacterium]
MNARIAPPAEPVAPVLNGLWGCLFASANLTAAVRQQADGRVPALRFCVALLPVANV